MRILLLLLTLLFTASPARAEFLISNAILEFTPGGPMQQDIELISHTPKDSDYILTEIGMIMQPGGDREERLVAKDPADAGLLVTPDRTILPGGSRKLLRFVLLDPPGPAERIYRVAVKPTIRGVENESRLGLKVLVGYEVLVIVRPSHPRPAFTATRKGDTLHVTNNGNTNILFQNGQQCAGATDCLTVPVLRSYPGQSTTLSLPRNAPVTFSIWDGAASTQQTY